MKRPAFQFYPGDWQRDAALRSCSVGARGLWIEMICVMHQADPYGHLVVNGQPIPPDTLARMVGASKREIGIWLGELEGAGVFSRDGATIVSRRMVRDENLRKVRAAGGKLGGNPALKDNRKVGDKVNHAPNLQPTPSSSSSSSSSSSTSNPTPLAPSDESLVAVSPVNGKRKNGVHKQFAEGATVIAIPLIGEAEYDVHQSLVDELDRCYPAVDCVQTLREIRVWNLANPRERKTEAGILRHINRWFAKEQNKG